MIVFLSKKQDLPADNEDLYKDLMLWYEVMLETKCYIISSWEHGLKKTEKLVSEFMTCERLFAGLCFALTMGCQTPTQSLYQGARALHVWAVVPRMGEDVYGRRERPIFSPCVAVSGTWYFHSLPSS